MDSHVSGTDGQIRRIPLRIASPSSIFVRFSLLRLFPVFKPEEMVRRKEIHHQRAAHRRNRGLFWRVGQIILYGRLEKVGESSDQMYRAERRLCWEIKKNRLKILLCFSKNFIDLRSTSYRTRWRCYHSDIGGYLCNIPSWSKSSRNYHQVMLWVNWFEFCFFLVRLPQLSLTFPPNFITIDICKSYAVLSTAISARIFDLWIFSIFGFVGKQLVDFASW